MNAAQLDSTGRDLVPRLTLRARVRYHRLAIAWWFARLTIWLADPDDWHIYGRRQDGSPVICGQCGHVARRMDMLHAYRIFRYDDSDEFVDLCPQCGGEV